jgi:prepilin-type N-terminal cleavage/methylation domain-containing protein
MVRRRRGRARGMTLIEVMIALLVTTVALLGALATVGATIRGANFSRNATEASVLAQARLEAMVSLPAGTVTLSTPIDGDLPDETLDALGNLGTIYTRRTTWGTTPDKLRRTVTVTVTWKDGLGMPHKVVAARQKDPQ